MSGRGHAALLGIGLLAGGCASLAPPHVRPKAPVPAEWPIPPTTGTTPSPAAGEDARPAGDVVDVGWRDFIPDPRLEQVVALALANNRDLRAAVLNVERARATWAIRRADRVPSVAAGVTAGRQRLPEAQTGTGSGVTVSTYGLEVGVTAYEVDLFGRVRNLSQAALERYLATGEARRGAQIALVSEVASVWLALAADRELQRLAEETVASQESSFRLTERRYELGAVSGLEVSQAQTTVESARVDAARFAGDVARDLNLLTFLVGGPVDPALLPDGFDRELAAFPAVPAGLPSESLLHRPDVIGAEHFLRAAHADIGAARAAFLPRITLTGAGGLSSDQLSSLFDSGTGTWSFFPRVTIPIFQGGRLRAALRVAEVDRELALTDYERALQAGFREVADALALAVTMGRQRAAQEALVAAAGRAYELSQARHEAGRDSYLVLLDSQRVYYGAQQGLIVTRLAEQANRIELYRALGGGWRETAEAPPPAVETTE